jgi:hypothetical protein
MLDYFTSFIKQRVCQELYGKKKVYKKPFLVKWNKIKFN